MLLFSMTVDNEYTAQKLSKAAEKLGFEMLWQWVYKKGKKGPMVIACDFITK